MVQPHGDPHPPPQHLPAPPRLQQSHAEPLPLPRHLFRPRHNLRLQLPPWSTKYAGNKQHPSRVFFPAYGVRAGPAFL